MKGPTQAAGDAHHRKFGVVGVPADLSPREARAFLARLDDLSNSAAEALERGLLEKAETLSAEIVAEYPDVIDGHWMRARLCARQCRWQEAKAAYDAVLDLIHASPAGFDKSVYNDMLRARDKASRHASEKTS